MTKLLEGGGLNRIKRKTCWEYRINSEIDSFKKIYVSYLKFLS